MMPSRFSVRPRQGFTLIEILVVIAIIITLAGVSYTIYSHSMETASRTRCMDNMHKISDWGKEFASRYGGILPASGMKLSRDNNPFGNDKRVINNWWDALALVVNEGNKDNMARNTKENHILPSSFRCTADNHLEDRQTEDQEATPETISYTSWLTSVNGRPVRVSSGSIPRGIPWISEGNPIHARSVRRSEDFDEIVGPALERHDGAIGVLYADWSIKFIDDASFDKIYKVYKP